MFVRVMRAPAGDPVEIQKLWGAWQEKLAPLAGGWVSSVAGITDSAEFVSIVRYEYEATARIQDRKREQIAWWNELRDALDGEPRIWEARDSDVLLAGGDDAGFVQVIQGTAPDTERMRSVNLGMEALLLRHRPDIIGSEIVWHPDGMFTKIAYFSTLDAARMWESREFPGGVKALFEELMGLIEGIEFLNIEDPWIDAL